MWNEERRKKKLPKTVLSRGCGVRVGKKEKKITYSRYMLKQRRVRLERVLIGHREKSEAWCEEEKPESLEMIH